MDKIKELEDRVRKLELIIIDILEGKEPSLELLVYLNNIRR